MPSTASARANRACARMLALALALLVAVPAAAAAAPPGDATVRADSAHAAAALAAKQSRPGGDDAATVTSRVVPGQYLVELAAGVSPVDIAGDFGQGMRMMRRYRRAMNGFAAAMSAQLADQVRADPRVIAVEADAEITLSTAQVNPAWGLDRIDQRRRPYDDYYNYDASGRGVIVYVVDTGVYRGHSQFGDRVLRGYDATGAGLTGDCVGHGTHVAGTVAGRTYGVAKLARIVPVRVLNCRGAGTKTQLIDGLDWIVRHHRRGTPAVANLSLGGPGSRLVDRAVGRVLDDKVTVVAAAGNEGRNACYYSPARVPGVLTVGATDQWDYSPYWSNYGPCLDLFAPGVGIRSATTRTRMATTAQDGTSMSAPFVSGAAVMYLAQHRSAGPTTVARALRAQATPQLVRYAGWNTTQKLLHIPSHIPTHLLVGMTDTSLDKGERVGIRSILRSALTGAALPSSLLRLYARPTGAVTWQYVATRRTDAGGRAAFTHQPLRSMQYQVRHPRSATTAGRVSSARSVAVSGKLATTLGIAASLPRVTYGGTVTIGGTVRRLVNRTSVGNSLVQLQRRPAGLDSWTTAATTRANSQGLAQFSFAPSRNTAYRLSFAGTPTLAPVLSTVRSVSVRFQVSAGLSATTGVVGQDPIDLSGRVQPGATLAGDRFVQVEYQPPWDSEWRRLATVHYDAAGNYSHRVFRLDDCCAGTYRYRVRAPGDGRNAEQLSRVMTAEMTS